MGIGTADSKRVDTGTLMAVLRPRHRICGNTETTTFKGDYRHVNIMLRLLESCWFITIRVWLVELDVRGDYFVFQCQDALEKRSNP